MAFAFVRRLPLGRFVSNTIKPWGADRNRPMHGGPCMGSYISF